MNSGQLFYLLAGFAVAVADDASSTQEDASSASSTPTFEVTIPETKGNPFIHTTTLPEGTLFIIFGSVLLAIVIALIVWRVASVVMMRKTIARGGQFQTLENTYGGPFVDPVADGDGTELPPTIDKKAEARARDKQIRQSMFFSPTAQVMSAGNVSQPMVASSYLPAGYYSQPQTIDSSSQRRPYSVAGSMRPPSTVAGTSADAGRRVRQRPPSMMLDDLINREQKGVE